MRPLVTTGFRDYLIRVRRITDTPEGELAAAFKAEWRTFPDIKSWPELRGYLQRRRKSDEVIRVAYRVWRAWLVYARRVSEDEAYVRYAGPSSIAITRGSKGFRKTGMHSPFVPIGGK